MRFLLTVFAHQEALYKERLVPESTYLTAQRDINTQRGGIEACTTSWSACPRIRPTRTARSSTTRRPRPTSSTGSPTVATGKPAFQDNMSEVLWSKLGTEAETYVLLDRCTTPWWPAVADSTPARATWRGSR